MDAAAGNRLLFPRILPKEYNLLDYDYLAFCASIARPSYTQAEAIEDGVLIYTGTMTWEASRLWYVLFIASRVIRTRSGSGDRLLF